MRPRHAVLTLVLASGCGRVGFDPHARRDGAGPGPLDAAASDGDTAAADGARADGLAPIPDGSTELRITEVKPPWSLPAGQDLAVLLEGDTGGVEVLVDGQPCLPAELTAGGVIYCGAPRHAPAIVEITATNASGASARWSPFSYLVPGPIQYGGPADDRTSGAAVGPDGSIYVSGATTGSLAAPNAGDFDAILLKLDSTGALSWTAQLGTPAFDFARDVVVAPDGDAIVVGYGAGDLGPSGDFSGGDDIFVARYAPDGTPRWIRQYGTAGNDQSWDLGVAADGAIVLSAWTDGAFPGFTNAGGIDYAILRLLPDGTLEWARQGGTAADDHGHSVAVGRHGEAYLVGYTRGALEPPAPNAGGLDAFVARFEADGTRSWIRQRGSPLDDRAQDATVGYDRTIWLAGRTDGAIDGEASAGGQDVFVMRFSGEGAHELTGQYGTAGTDDSYGVQVDDSGNAYLGCSTTGVFPGSTGAGGTDACFLSLDRSGALRFVRQFGSAGEDGASSCAHDVAYSYLFYLPLITNGRLGAGAVGGNDAAIARFDDEGNLY